MSISDVVKAITVTAELTGATMSGAALAVMAQDLLSAYPEDQIIRALTRCRKELSRPLTAGAVFDRLSENDGRPGVEEAWAMCPRSEADSICWTLEMREAFSIASPLLDSGDKIGARMAFKDAYERLVRESRENGFKTGWEMSLGWDVDGRQKAVAKAVAVKAISAQAAVAYLPAPEGGINLIECLAGKEPLRITGPEIKPEEIGRIRERLAGIKQFLSSKAKDRRNRKIEEDRAEDERVAEAKARAAEFVKASP